MKRAAFALLLFAQTAHAYVRQTTSMGKGIAWKSGCVFLTPDAHGTKDLTADKTMEQINAAANNWVGATSSCSYLHFNIDAPATGKTAGLDGVNLVIWLEDRWGHEMNGMFVPYSTEVPAQTTIIFVDDAKSDRNGEILDSDTELNGVNFQYGVFLTPPMTCQQSPCAMDVQNTLTHELGHSVGLDHTCYNGETPTRPVDNNGNPSPTCGSPQANIPAILEATMYNFACCGEIKKNTPEADDVAGYCAMYPTARDPHGCARVQPHGDTGCACAIASRPPSTGAALALLALTALVCIRIRRRSGCAPASCGRPRSSDAA